jgi:tRNA A-37 threonylcarbamoyl transferase component Bud32
VEKRVYQEANAGGLSVPQLFEFDDTDRKLCMGYIERHERSTG